MASKALSCGCNLLIGHSTPPFLFRNWQRMDSNAVTLMTVAIALPTVPQLTIAQQGVKFVHALSLANSTQYEWPWSSLVEGDEGCIGPSGKLLCFWQMEKNYPGHAWQCCIHVWLLCRSSCSSPSTKEIHGLAEQLRQHQADRGNVVDKNLDLNAPFNLNALWCDWWDGAGPPKR